MGKRGKPLRGSPCEKAWGIGGCGYGRRVLDCLFLSCVASRFRLRLTECPVRLGHASVARGLCIALVPVLRGSWWDVVTSTFQRKSGVSSVLIFWHRLRWGILVRGCCEQVASCFAARTIAVRVPRHCIIASISVFTAAVRVPRPSACVRQPACADPRLQPACASPRAPAHIRLLV